MKIALITDTHFGARNDSQIFTDHFMKFYNDIFFPYLEENDIKTLIHLGDLVDRRKYINYVTLNSIRRDFIFRLGDMGVDTHIIIGNHDTYYKNTNRINAVQELFTTSEGKYEPWIYDEPVIKTFDGLDIFFVPWICPENVQKTMKMLTDTTAQILMGHLEVTGYSMYKGLVCEHGLNKNVFNKFYMVLSGHFNYKNGDGNIQYLGTPYELMWSDADDIKGFYIFDTDTRDLEFIANPYKMFHTLRYNDEDGPVDTEQTYPHLKDTYIKLFVESKKHPYSFDRFMDKLYESGVAKITIVEEIVDSEWTKEEIVDLAQDTVTLINNEIDGIEEVEDKPRMKKLIKDLYMESLSL